jgi:2',3'-cyclic-nucleotide 2'-phosphodiesterase (5'-nucleotidase family)
LGGLSKKAFQLDKLRTQSAGPHLTVDGGGLLFKNSVLLPGQRQQNQIIAEGILDSYGLMAYDAVGIAGRDLAAGLDFLLKMQSRAKFPLLSANLVRSSTDKPLFPPFIIKDAGNLRIGIIGLTGPDAGRFISPGDNAVLMSWQKVLGPIVSPLAAECDLILLLSSYPLIENEKIAEEFPDIHIIIQTGYRGANSAPKLTTNSLICQTGQQGKYLGVLQVDWQPSKKWGVANVQKYLATKTRELDLINGRLAGYRARLAQEALQTSKGYQLQLQNQQRVREEIASLQEQERQQQLSKVHLSTFVNRFIAMETSLPDDPEVRDLVNGIKKKIHEIGRRSAAEQTAQSGKTGATTFMPAGFAGSSVCRNCHPAQTIFWKSTSHAASYRSLETKQQQFNLDCLPCHVTSDRQGSGKALLSLAPPLQQVGCEVCHGPGQLHVAGPGTNTIIRKPPVTVCLRCHTEERDDTFNYERKLPKVSCPHS